ncbi:MAG: SMP-30/gluconolactonase/LRE family protein, partial [Maribacter sp.]|nr:SMP-30/gluconolactonase/LRE family protein [Maribacter sp.]
MKNIPIHKAQLVYDAKAILGEGPVWDWRGQFLYWVDIEGKTLHRHEPSVQKNQSWHFNAMIGAAVPKNDGQLLLALESGLASFDPKTAALTHHTVLESSNPLMRHNDGKVGPDGHFWIGTMHKEFEPGSGNLYRVANDLNTSIQIPKTTISNGMAWSSDHRLFYYIDSPTFRVSAYDFDKEKGVITNKRTVIEVPKAYGSPDGMCIDTAGMLWIAHWGGSCVRRWNPSTGKVMEILSVEAPHVTSCCFGGKDLNTLYITTARSGLNEKQLLAFPLSGGLF